MEKRTSNLAEDDENAQERTRLIKTSDEDKKNKAKFMTMFKYAEKIDIIISGIELVATIIFSLTPIFVILFVGEIIEKLEQGWDANDSFYEDMRELAIKCYICAIVALIACWIAVLASVKLGSLQGMKWRKN